MGILMKRADKMAFYGVEHAGGVVFVRMTGFTDLSVSKNPKEYTRQYVDEPFERADVVAYSPSVSYAFDQYTQNPVHLDIARIAEEELLGSAAVREIVFVDFTKPYAGGYLCTKRSFSVIPDSEGSGTDAYTRSGTLKANGLPNKYVANSEDGWNSCYLMQILGSLGFDAMEDSDLTRMEGVTLFAGGNYDLDGLSLCSQLHCGPTGKSLKMAGIESADARVKFDGLFGQGELLQMDVGRRVKVHASVYLNGKEGAQPGTVRLGLYGQTDTYSYTPYHSIVLAVPVNKWVTLTLEQEITDTMRQNQVLSVGIDQYGTANVSSVLYIDDLAVEELPRTGILLMGPIDAEEDDDLVFVPNDGFLSADGTQPADPGDLEFTTDVER